MDENKLAFYAAIVVGMVYANPKIRQAVKYVSEKMVVTATRRHKPRGRMSRVEVVVTIGAPNYKARQYIKACKKAGEPLPVKNVQIRMYPKPRKK